MSLLIQCNPPVFVCNSIAKAEYGQVSAECWEFLGCVQKAWCTTGVLSFFPSLFFFYITNLMWVIKLSVNACVYFFTGQIVFAPSHLGGARSGHCWCHCTGIVGSSIIKTPPTIYHVALLYFLASLILPLPPDNLLMLICDHPSHGPSP